MFVIGRAPLRDILHRPGSLVAIREWRKLTEGRPAEGDFDALSPPRKPAKIIPLIPLLKVSDTRRYV